MFIVTKCIGKKVCILDTDDLVEEWYSIFNLRRGLSGIDIFGITHKSNVIYSHPYKDVAYFYYTNSSSKLILRYAYAKAEFDEKGIRGVWYANS